MRRACATCARYWSTSATIEMRRRSTFWSRASDSSRSSGPSKPSRLTISSPSPGAITSGDAAAKPSAAGWVSGSLMQLGFSPAGAPTASVFGPLSPCRKQRCHLLFSVGEAGLAERLGGARQSRPAGVKASPGGRGHRPGIGHDLFHLVALAVAVEGDVAAGRKRARRALAERAAQRLHGEIVRQQKAFEADMVADHVLHAAC